jgi:hypothetical protein
MRNAICAIVMAGWAALACFGTADVKTKAGVFPLESLDELEVVNAKPEVATHLGRHAVHIVNMHEQGSPTADESMVILRGSEFKDGTIEAEVAGTPRAGAAPDIRGFLGIAFRVHDQAKKFECFYLRMTNGRSDDQLRRNHSAQYESSPDFPWHKLREEKPGMYESYVDLEPGAWTKIKIVVEGVKARLYVNGASQPCLVVNDLKLGETSGAVALWVGDSTDAYFSNLRIE